MNNRWNKFLVAFLFLFFVLVRSFSSSEIEPTRIDVLEKESEAFLGKWEGFLKDKDGNQVQIVLEILKNEDKTWKCLFSMPHHGLQGASVQDLSIKERTISITIPLVMFTYSGSLKEDQQTIEGVLKRDKTEIKLNLVKKDTHVPSTQNLKAAEKILQEAGNKNYKTVELSGLNHLFQTARTGLVTEYSLLEETMAPVVLKTIGDWIVDQVK